MTQLTDRQQQRNSLLPVLFAFALLFAASRVAVAQDRRDTSGRPDSAIAQPTTSSPTTTEREVTPAENLLPRPYVLKLWHSLTGHLHNKIIHVPIGFGLSAFFLSLLSLRWREYEAGIRWLVPLAALGAIAAFVTGTQQAMALEGGSKDWVIALHRTLGILTLTSLCAWALVLWLPRIKRWSFLAAVVSCGLLLVTGFFGGILAHG